MSQVWPKLFQDRDLQLEPRRLRVSPFKGKKLFFKWKKVNNLQIGFLLKPQRRKFQSRPGTKMSMLNSTYTTFLLLIHAKISLRHCVLVQFSKLSVRSYIGGDIKKSFAVVTLTITASFYLFSSFSHQNFITN